MTQKETKGKHETLVKHQKGHTRSRDVRVGTEGQYEEPDLLALQRAVTRPDLARPEDILALQRTVGNQALIRTMRPCMTQPKEVVKIPSIMRGKGTDSDQEMADTEKKEVFLRYTADPSTWPLIAKWAI